MPSQVEPSLVDSLVRTRQALSGANEPFSLSFVDERTVLFLGTDASETGSWSKPETRLHVAILPPVGAGEAAAPAFYEPPALPWIPLLDASDASTDGEASGSSCEDVDMDRLYENMDVNSFQVHRESRAVLLPEFEALRRFVLPGTNEVLSRDGVSVAHSPRPQLVSAPVRKRGALSDDSDCTFLNPTLSPDGTMVSFVRSGDLWVLDVKSGLERRLTFSENPSLPEDMVEEANAWCESENRVWATAKQPSRKDYLRMPPTVVVDEVSRPKKCPKVDNVTPNQPKNAGDDCSAMRTRVCGMADYITNEEFGRYTGAWWRPERSPVTGNFQILYLLVDLSASPVTHIPAYNAPGGERFHYPKPGSQNCVSEPAVVDVPSPPAVSDAAGLAAWASADPRDVTDYCSWAPSSTIGMQFPSCAEYVVRAGWISEDKVSQVSTSGPGRGRSRKNEQACAWAKRDPGRFWVQLLDRKQKVTTFVACSFANGGSGSVVVQDVTSPGRWVNVNEGTRFLKRQQRVIFTSERTGYAHLYIQDVPPVQTSARVGSGPFEGIESDAKNLEKDEQSRPVTFGDSWMVENIEFIDEERELVYFSCTVGSPLERQLAVASYAHGSSPVRINQLTMSGLTYSSFDFSEDGRRAVLSFSSTKVSTQSVVYDIYGLDLDGDVSSISLFEVARFVNPVPSLSGHVGGIPVSAPEIFSFPASDDGTTLYGSLYRPSKTPSGSASEPGPYPTILVVYGGPSVQTVRNEWHLTMQLKNQLLAAHGYAVVMIDGRGSYRRGAKFEEIFSRDGFGKTEIADQVTGLEYLARKGVVDRQRIGCTGWSYGAYAGCMLLAKYPEVFQFAVCGAPVVQWEGYNVGYSEKYLGDPRENSLAYSSSSLLSYVQSFPDAEGRLMLVHSVLDENVHCAQTLELVNALVRLNKPHALVLYPNERHGLRSASSQLHFESTFLRFVDNALNKT